MRVNLISKMVCASILCGAATAMACAAWPIPPPGGRIILEVQRHGWFIQQYDSTGDGQTDLAFWFRATLNPETGQIGPSRFPMFLLKDFGLGEVLDDGNGYNGLPDAIFINTASSLDIEPRCVDIRLYGRDLHSSFKSLLLDRPRNDTI